MLQFVNSTLAKVSPFVCGEPTPHAVLFVLHRPHQASNSFGTAKADCSRLLHNGLVWYLAIIGIKLFRLFAYASGVGQGRARQMRDVPSHPSIVTDTCDYLIVNRA